MQQIEEISRFSPTFPLSLIFTDVVCFRAMLGVHWLCLKFGVRVTMEVYGSNFESIYQALCAYHCAGCYGEGKGYQLCLLLRKFQDVGGKNCILKSEETLKVI